jgi:hypothetical protein
MTALVINGDTSGSITLQVPAAAGSGTVHTLPAATGTVMVSGNMPSFSAWTNTNQGLSGTTETKVVLGSEQWDTHNCFASNRFTPTVAGYYMFNGSIAFTAAVGGYASAYIWKNGARLMQASELQLTTSSYSALPITGMVYLNGTTDYVELYCTTQNGATIYGDATYLYTYFQGFMVRAA